MAVVERFKQESMYGLSAKKKIAVVESWPLVEVRLYHGCNPFQSSSTSSIPPSFFVFAVYFTPPFHVLNSLNLFMLLSWLAVTTVLIMIIFVTRLL